MAINKIDVNKYKITIELGYDILGNRKRKTEIFNGTKQEAIKREAELKSEFYHIGKTMKINDLTFEELSEIFIEKYCIPNISRVTTFGYKKSLKRINPIIGKIKLNKITPLILDNMYQELRIGKDGQELGYHSMYNLYKVVNVMFNQAIRWEIMDKNPNLKANKPKREQKEKRFYDMNQVKKLLDVLDLESIKYKTLIVLALDSGARRSEICALRWSDINMNTRMMSITKSLKVIEGVIDEKTTKTESSKREIMLSESTIKQLEEYREWQNAYKLVNKQRWVGTDDRVFTALDGSYMFPGTCDHILRKIVKKYNLDPICFHELRHTCASLLINSGIDPKTVSKRLGHADTSITMEIYTHSFEASKVACANKFDEMMAQMQNA
jgi:integrase